jgi:hypothetical protein
MPGNKSNYLYENKFRDKIEFNKNINKTKKVTFYPTVKVIKVESFKRYN